MRLDLMMWENKRVSSAVADRNQLGSRNNTDAYWASALAFEHLWPCL